MIKSYKDPEVKRIFDGHSSRKFPIQIQQVARRKLRMLNNAQNLNDLRIPPANRLEKLKGDLKGLHSIRVNEKWRIVFKWQTSDAYNVQIIDYH